MDRNAYRTPRALFYFAQKVLGCRFTHDAACTTQNALATPLWRLPGFKRGDSLSARWPDNLAVWTNPPYGRGQMAPFLGAARLTKSPVVLLIPPSNGETRYGWLHENAFELHLIGRISFLHPTKDEYAGSNRGGSSLFFLNTPKAGTRETWLLRDALAVGESMAYGETEFNIEALHLEELARQL